MSYFWLDVTQIFFEVDEFSTYLVRWSLLKLVLISLSLSIPSSPPSTNLDGTEEKDIAISMDSWFNVLKGGQKKSTIAVKRWTAPTCCYLYDKDTDKEKSWVTWSPVEGSAHKPKNNQKNHHRTIKDTSLTNRKKAQIHPQPSITREKIDQLSFLVWPLQLEAKRYKDTWQVPFLWRHLFDLPTLLVSGTWSYGIQFFSCFLFIVIQFTLLYSTFWSLNGRCWLR